MMPRDKTTYRCMWWCVQWRHPLRSGWWGWGGPGRTQVWGVQSGYRSAAPPSGWFPPLGSPAPTSETDPSETKNLLLIYLCGRCSLNLTVTVFSVLNSLFLLLSLHCSSTWSLYLKQLWEISTLVSLMFPDSSSHLHLLHCSCWKLL